MSKILSTRPRGVELNPSEGEYVDSGAEQGDPAANAFNSCFATQLGALVLLSRAARA